MLARVEHRACLWACRWRGRSRSVARRAPGRLELGPVRAWSVAVGGGWRRCAPMAAKNVRANLLRFWYASIRMGVQS